MLKAFKRFFSKAETLVPDVIVPTREDAPRIFTRLFSSDDGQKALAYLRSSVNARVAGPAAEESALRYYDGQRGLLQTITTLIEQGKN